MRWNLYNARKRLKISRYQMAAALGVAYETYSQYETGRRWPSGKVIVRLENFFGIPASELLLLADGEPNATL